MKHANTQKIYNYWQSVRGTAQLPYRYNIDPTQFTDILPDVLILDATDSHYKVKLAGSRICELFDRELRDTSFSTLFMAQDQTTPAAICKTILNESVPAIFGLIGHANKQTLPIEAILLPVKDREEKTSSLIGMLSPMSRPGWIGHKPLMSLELLSFRVLWPESEMNSSLHEVQRYPTGGLMISTGKPDDVKIPRRPAFKVIEGGRQN